MHCCLQHSGKRFSVFRGHGVQESQRGRGYVAHGRFQATLLEGSWALLELILRNFFAVVFYIDVLSISLGCWKGFWEAKIVKKSRFRGVLGIMVFEI